MGGPDRSAAAIEELLEELRPRAFAIAYRMLGSVSEAEDVVQEGLLRLHRELDSGTEIASPGAFLATVVTRLSIDELRSARARRETYVGEWLPEPVITDPASDPAAQAEMADSLSTAFLVLLESLSPEQRAAFLLREVFDYPYDEIAEIVGRNETTARQLVSRARRHVGEGRPRFEVSREEGQRLAERFIDAAAGGDLEALEAVLAEDVSLHGDGGGKVPALARALYGRSRVAKTIRNWGRQLSRLEGVRFEPAEVNGGPGARTVDAEGRLLSVIAFDVAEGKIQAVNSVVNPDKLRHLGELADAGSLFRRLRSAQR
ncbi:MAG TPA: RNA polymerase sigma-70 factor [Solirubrobacterales bacterium]|nr:RNA polymerase sigma-70 factor [Solirubrobacterales bacterium]